MKPKLKKPATDNSVASATRNLSSPCDPTPHVFPREFHRAVEGLNAQLAVALRESGLHEERLAKACLEIEQLRVQLAACAVAARDGSEEQEVERFTYGWSPAYGDVLELRRKCSRLEKQVIDQSNRLIAALVKKSDRIKAELARKKKGTGQTGARRS